MPHEHDGLRVYAAENFSESLSVCLLSRFGASFSQPLQKYSRVPGKQVGIPGEIGTEFDVAITHHAEVGTVNRGYRHAELLLKRAIYRRVILHRVAFDNGNSTGRHRHLDWLIRLSQHPLYRCKLGFVVPFVENALPASLAHGLGLRPMIHEPNQCLDKARGGFRITC